MLTAWVLQMQVLYPMAFACTSGGKAVVSFSGNSLSQHLQVQSFPFSVHKVTSKAFTAQCTVQVTLELLTHISCTSFDSICTTALHHCLCSLPNP